MCRFGIIVYLVDVKRVRRQKLPKRLHFLVRVENHYCCRRYTHIWHLNTWNRALAMLFFQERTCCSIIKNHRTCAYVIGIHFFAFTQCQSRTFPIHTASEETKTRRGGEKSIKQITYVPTSIKLFALINAARCVCFWSELTEFLLAKRLNSTAPYDLCKHDEWGFGLVLVNA